MECNPETKVKEFKLNQLLCKLGIHLFSPLTDSSWICYRVHKLTFKWNKKLKKYLVISQYCNHIWHDCNSSWWYKMKHEGRRSRHWLQEYDERPLGKKTFEKYEKQLEETRLKCGM